MDDLKMLAELGRHLDEEPPAALARQRTRLVETAQGRRRSRRYPAMFRGRVPLIGIAVLGTSAAVGVPAAVLSGAGETVRPATGGPTVNVARSAPSIQNDTAPRPDQFVFVETRQQYESCRIVTSECRLDPPSTRRVWMSADGTHDGRIEQMVAGRPMSATMPGCRNGVQIEDAYKKTKDGSAERKGKVTRPCTPAPADRSRLPADPQAMRSHLYAQSAGGRSREELMFKAAGEVSMEAYVPAKVRKALFAATSRIAGVTRDRKAVDPAGRRTVGLAFISPVDGIRREYFFDPKTYQYLGVRDVATRAIPDMRTTKGEVTGSAAVLRLVVVDRVGQLPD
jgi:hypothetical protein